MRKAVIVLLALGGGGAAHAQDEFSQDQYRERPVPSVVQTVNKIFSGNRRRSVPRASSRMQSNQKGDAASESLTDNNVGQGDRSGDFPLDDGSHAPSVALRFRRGKGGNSIAEDSDVGELYDSPRQLFDKSPSEDDVLSSRKKRDDKKRLKRRVRK